jgi:thiamine biosynthesis lipoprotein
MNEKVKKMMVFKDCLVAQDTFPAMGTLMAHKIYGLYAGDCLDAIQYEIEHLEAIFSRFFATSEISRINQSAGIKPVEVSNDTFALIKNAIDLSTRCNGLYDITISPLVQLWGIGKAVNRIPDKSSILRVLALVDDRDILLNEDLQTIFLRKTGQAIDLGGIAKGYAAEKVFQLYQVYGIQSAYANLGGNVIAIGSKLDGSPWRVGIQHPRNEESLIGSISIKNQAVVTSGDYQRYMIAADGRRYHHILDPRTGYPAASGLISVSIVSGDAILADVLSTAILIAGLERGLEILTEFPDTEAVLVNQDLDVFVTHGLKNFIQTDQHLDFI